MSEIKLTVDDVNIKIVLSILKNLKSGLISSIETNLSTSIKKTHYKPQRQGIIYEHESGANDTQGKYSISAYKERLKRKS
ncbi:MAG: hypothetical protein DSZ04_02490 [Sulfurimonas sp.]|nr:MAG: hypothetical protein DSZ04_02490 [Sulfurimonas sp.]